MKEMNSYLTFDGNAREAMEFYKTCLGGELAVMTFADSPMKAQTPPGAEKRVMHARLKNGATVLMASDTMPGMPFHQGNNFSLASAVRRRRKATNSLPHWAPAAKSLCLFRKHSGLHASAC